MKNNILPPPPINNLIIRYLHKRMSYNLECV